MLVIAEVADAVGLFDWLGAQMGRAAGSSAHMGRAGGSSAHMGRAGGSSAQLFGLVVLVAIATTTVLSLDATAALLTPVVLRTARRLGVEATPHALATVQLANGSSLLLPIANLTNLLVWPATGLSFTAFAGHMALPTIGSSAAIGCGLWLRHRRSLAAPAAAGHPPVDRLPAGGAAVAAGIALLLVGFGAASLAGIEVAWVAAAGAIVLGAAAIGLRAATLPQLGRAVSLGMLAFVAALAVVVALADEHGLGARLRGVLPSGTSLAALAGVALVAALLANVINNLPAALVLLVALPHGQPGPLLAALLGLNIGPNVTPAGSLATLLWRRAARREQVEVPWREVLVSGALTTPVALALGVGGLWVTLR